MEPRIVSDMFSYRYVMFFGTHTTWFQFIRLCRVPIYTIRSLWFQFIRLFFLDSGLWFGMFFGTHCASCTWF
jgi:hypothetical protein